jgi:hypothetical protein
LPWRQRSYCLVMKITYAQKGEKKPLFVALAILLCNNLSLAIQHGLLGGGVPTSKVLPKYANFFIHYISDFYHALCSKMYTQLFMPYIIKRQYLWELQRNHHFSTFNQMIPCCGRGSRLSTL